MTRTQNHNLRQGGPGRPRGCKNKRTRAVDEIAQGMLSDPTYLKSLRRRLLAGKAPHMEVLLHHYAYGKPMDRITLLNKQTNADQAISDMQGQFQAAREKFFATLELMRQRLLVTGRLLPNGDILIPAAERSPMGQLASYMAAGGETCHDTSPQAISG